MGQNESLSDRNMKINRQRILLHRTFKMSVEIEGVITFPHGLDGLKLWEAGIVLARFVILHHE